MDFKVLKKEGNNVMFTVSNINPSIANALRRYIISFVPTMAVDEIEIKNNSSGLYDEMLGLRLGLVPLKTDLKSYKLWDGEEDQRPKSAQYELKLTLKTKGPKNVLAEELQSQDPKIVPAEPKMVVAKLLENQEIELTATARLGQGREHAKFSPGLVVYRGVPQLVTSKESNVDECLKELEGIVEKKGSNLAIKDLTQWNEAHENKCEMCNIDVVSSTEEFLFTIESWGQLSPKDMLHAALDLFESKLSAFEDGVKKLK